MIRVHCFVSCVCESLKRVEGADERPFYFGVWDAPFHVTSDFSLAYHEPGSGQSFFCEWYERLYGARIHEWYEHARSKEQNIERLIQLVEEGRPRRNVIVMLDLFRLPERENKFNQNPFPHYVMLQSTSDPDRWLMQDPDFRWEGVLDKARILDAVASPSVAGGYCFDEEELRPPDESAVLEYFQVCFRPRHNPFTDAIRSIIQAHARRRAPKDLAGLSAALREIPVLAIRKYAYEHGFAYFWRALDWDHEEFLRWCDEGDVLVKTFSSIHYRAMKLALTGDERILAELLDLLDQQDAREARMKQRLFEVFDAWRSRGAQLRTFTPFAPEGASA